MAFGGAARSAATGDLDTLRGAALSLVNQDRRQQGLNPLELTEILNEAAQSHARDMSRRDYYNHVSPEGQTVQDRYITQGGSRWRLVAENIGRCVGCPSPPTVARVESLHSGWMNSPGHRRNILTDGLDGFGFGIVVGEDQTLYAVQTFAGPGMLHGLHPGEEPVVLSPAEQVEQMVSDINQVRQRENVPPLKQNQSLGQASTALLPDAAGEIFRLDDPNVGLYEALPEGQSGAWRTLSVLTASCGGCGTRETAADIRSFREQWLENPQSANTLLDASFTHLGFAMRADGQGMKIAVALFGRRS
jgi:uncharacterized protein YkwD